MIRERFKNDVYKRVGGTDLGAKQLYNFVVAEPHNGWRETNINLTSKAYHLQSGHIARMKRVKKTAWNSKKPTKRQSKRKLVSCRLVRVQTTNITLTINCVFPIHTLIAIVPSPPIHVFIHRYG